MKKLFITLLSLCLIISATGCGKKNNEPENAPISEIPTATASEDAGEEATEDENAHPERTPENDRKEIENNIRDAEQLIADGNYDDATMIINSLKTRDLTKEEKERIKNLQKLMIRVSD